MGLAAEAASAQDEQSDKFAEMQSQNDYAEARRRAIAWMGDRYLLASPATRLHDLEYRRHT